MAYVSLSVNVGSYNDPHDRQGLAHFLEHMIFMGSEKYDDESLYSNYISANGGYCNAYTEFEWTNSTSRCRILVSNVPDMLASNMALTTF